MTDCGNITRQPVLFDLFCGRGGWSTAAAARGWRCVGFDIADHGYTAGELVLRRLPIPVAELLAAGGPDAIVASPPCEEFARAWLPWLRGDGKPEQWAIDLLAWSVSLVGCGVPVVVECSRFAGKHVAGGRAWGSYVLWGDVPALCPTPPRTKMAKSGMDPAARALIPFDLADWIIESFERRIVAREAA